jgi:hypothetical protein
MCYCMASGGNFLCFLVWREVVIFYGLLCGEWWSFFMFYCVPSGGNLCVIVSRVVLICYVSLCGEWC